MSNHGTDAFPEHEQLREFIQETNLDAKLAELTRKTKQYPEGKLTAEDHGAVAFGVSNYGGKVVVNFSEATKWFGMTPEQAVDLANTLIKHSRQANRIIGKKQKPLTVEL